MSAEPVASTAGEIWHHAPRARLTSRLLNHASSEYALVVGLGDAAAESAAGRLVAARSAVTSPRCLASARRYRPDCESFSLLLWYGEMLAVSNLIIVFLFPCNV